MKLNRIQSRELYPVPERPHYTIHLSKGQVTFHVMGKEMPDDDCGNVIIQLINALNASEKQIEHLFTVIQNAEINKDEFSEYLEEFPEDQDFVSKYKIEDLKDALFHSLMKKDDKKVSHYINQIYVLENKTK